MEIRVLRYFLAIAREEGISRAAERLHVTQPTLSRQLSDMEAKLGKKLFNRSSRRITLTEEGMLLRKRAEEIIALVDKAEAELQASEEEIGGDIYIGGGETHAMRLIADIIKGIGAEHPSINFHIHSGNAEDVMERLDKGLLDFGLLISPVNISKYDNLKLPCKDVWGVLMRKDSPFAGKTSIAPKDLWDKPLLCSRQRLVSEEMAKWMRRDYEELRHIATYNLVYNASLLVDAGIGYALCLDKLVNTSGESSLCFRPLQPRLEAEIYVIWKKYQVFSKAAALFLQRVQDAFGE